MLSWGAAASARARDDGGERVVGQVLRQVPQRVSGRSRGRRRGVVAALHDLAGLAARCMTRGALALLSLYQRYVSAALPRRCRYYPTCSAYAVGAVRIHGLFKGLLLSAWRLLRCNPLSPGGVDHVPEKGRWRDAGPRDVVRFTHDQG